MNKLWLILAFIGSNCFGQAVPGQYEDLNTAVESFKTASANQNEQQINTALVNLSLAINGKLQVPDGSTSDNPSQARVEAGNEVKAALLPIEPALITLAAANQPGNSANATVILGNSEGDQQIYQALKANLQNSMIPGNVTSAISSLFQIGMYDDSVQQIATKRISEYQNPNQTSIANALLGTSSYYPLPQALPIFMQMLNTANSDSAKRAIANAISALGEAGSPALPKLEEILETMKSNHADYRDINEIERAISVIKGEATSLYKAVPANSTVAVNNATTSNDNSVSNKTSPEQPTPQPSQEPAVDTSFPFGLFAIVGASIILLAGLGYFLWYKKP